MNVIPLLQRRNRAHAIDFRQRPIRSRIPAQPAVAFKAKIRGKKRHLLVDTDGLLMHAVVHAADIQDHGQPGQTTPPAP